MSLVRAAADVISGNAGVPASSSSDNSMFSATETPLGKTPTLAEVGGMPTPLKKVQRPLLCGFNVLRAVLFESPEPPVGFLPKPPPQGKWNSMAPIWVSSPARRVPEPYDQKLGPVPSVPMPTVVKNAAVGTPAVLSLLNVLMTLVSKAWMSLVAASSTSL